MENLSSSDRDDKENLKDPELDQDSKHSSGGIEEKSPKNTLESLALTEVRQKLAKLIDQPGNKSFAVAEYETSTKDKEKAQRSFRNIVRELSEKIKKLELYLEYPPGVDGGEVQFQGYSKLADGILISGTGAILAGIVELVGWQALNVFQDILLTGSVFVGMGSFLWFISTQLYGFYLQIIEFTNRNYVELLSVSKTMIRESSLIYPYMKEVSPDFEPGIIGELHFTGPDESIWERFDGPISIMRQGARDLFRLAQRCESGWPEYGNLEYFYGGSSIIGKQFEKYGFKVFPIKDEKYNPIKQVFMNLFFGGSSFLSRIKDKKSSSKQEALEREPMVAIISKEDLIANSKNLARLAGIKD